MARLRQVASGAAIAATLAVVPLMQGGAAHADYGKAIYQIAISVNCDNPQYCLDQNGTPSLGGFWGWAALFGTANGGTGDGQFAGCGHVIAGGTPQLAGAGHQSQDVTWTVGAGSAGPRTLIITSETDTFTGHGTPTTVTIPSESADTGVPLPSSPGTIHVSTSDVFGAKLPGVSYNIQVVRLPNT